MRKRSVSNPDSPAREAERLLAGLEAEGACIAPDPAEAGRLVLRQRRGTVSLAAGRFRREALEHLESRGLVERSRSGPGAATISEAGRAHLRRRRSRPDERFQAQHAEIVDAPLPEEGPSARVRLDAAESPLAWLRRRKDRTGAPLIDAAAYEAGERLRRDLTVAQWLPGVTVNWGAPAGGSGGGHDPAGATDRALAARQRVGAALAAVGSDLSGLLVDLCGFLKGLERIEQERGWPRRSAKVIVGLALGRLAEHYGLAREARGPDRPRGLRAWRAAPEAGPAEEETPGGG